MTEQLPNETPCGASYLVPLKKLLERKFRKAAIFTHAYPDPDAIGSIMAMEWLLSKALGLQADGFMFGKISHPQNVAMSNLLDPPIRSLEEYKAEDYDFHILVDTVPSNAGIGDKAIKFDLVIDHHKEVCPVDFDGLFINLKAGSCCATVYEIMQKLELSFSEEVAVDLRVATAMLIGISTDTENLMSDDCTEFEFHAWEGLFPFRSPIPLRKIVNFDRPKFWIDTMAASVLKASIEDGVGIVGMGIIPSKHRDMIADMSQQMVQWEGVDTSVAFAMVDGDRIEGSVRSINVSISIPKLSKELGGKHGNGGGKLGKGAYKVDLAGGGIEEDDSAETKQRMWELFRDKEICRIRRILKK